MYNCSSTNRDEISVNNVIAKRKLTPEELLRVNALNRYKKIRRAERLNPSRMKVVNRVEQKKNLKKRVKRRYSIVRNIELKKEIEQNMVYYCYKHENDTDFKGMGSCLDYTSSIYDSCRGEYWGREILLCLKRRLHLR